MWPPCNWSQIICDRMKWLFSHITICSISELSWWRPLCAEKAVVIDQFQARPWWIDLPSYVNDSLKLERIELGGTSGLAQLEQLDWNSNPVSSMAHWHIYATVRQFSTAGHFHAAAETAWAGLMHYHNGAGSSDLRNEVLWINYKIK